MADGSNGTGVFGRNDGQEHDALSAASGSAAAAAVARSVAAYRRKSAEAGESLTRDGRAGEFSGSVIGRVRLESGGFQPERVGLGEFSGSVICRVRLESGGIPARKGRAGGNCGSVIGRVRLRRLGRRHHRRGLHRSRRRNGCRRRSCRRNDRRSRRWNGCRRSCRRNGR